MIIGQSDLQMKYFLYISFLLLVLGCNRLQTDTHSASFHAELFDSGKHDSMAEKIAPEELPADIKQVIREDDLFCDLNISEVTKITENDSTYYDMTFRDFDGQLIMVFYDERGQIIVP